MLPFIICVIIVFITDNPNLGCPLWLELLDDTGLACPLYDFWNVTKGQTCYGVGTTVVDCYATCGWIMQRSTGETNIGHIACKFIQFAWGNEVGTATVDGFPGLLKVEQGRAEAIHITIAGTEYAMVEQ